MVTGFSRPWLLLPSSVAHTLGIKTLHFCGKLRSFKTFTWSSHQWRGLSFANPLGISGGVDKDGDCIKAWWTFGAGFLEIGTVTPLPQPGNSGKVIDRSNRHQAVWNRMGFPSKGLEYFARQLQNLKGPRHTPLFANVGKNASTPLEKAHEDYLVCIRRLQGLVDAFVINISSPNTAGLRELLRKENLRPFLKPLVEASEGTPLLLKLSPDMSDESFFEALDVSLEAGIDGWILTNTSVEIREGLPFPKAGGVSGSPLAKRSRDWLRKAVQHLGDRKNDKLLISSGGIMDPHEAFERLRIGADLIQVYSALIFEGPGFFKRVADQSHVQLT